MSDIWVITVKTSLPGTCCGVSDLKCTAEAYHSFEEAKNRLFEIVKTYAFGDNAMFDGDGMLEASYWDDILYIEGWGDGPYTGIDPRITTNLLDMGDDSKHYFLYISDYFVGMWGQDAPSELYIDLFAASNSTERNLKNADKVRNYILMNASPTDQKSLYDKHWSKMEERLYYSVDNGKTLDDFFFYYVTLKTERKISADYYKEFKDMYLDADISAIKDAVVSMDEYSKLFQKWIKSDDKNNPELHNLKITGQDKCIPVVLKILHNYDNKVLTKADMESMLKILETYIVRREMCGRATNTIGEAFIKLLKNTDSLSSYKNCIKNDFTDKQGMPDDAELRKELLTRDFYNLSHSHYFLDRIEKSLNPAYTPDHRNVSIEHIMPQTIQSSKELYARFDYSNQEKEDRDWAKDLGANWESVHEKYCNTLGNLTLTGYNSKLSNCRFTMKKNLTSKADDGLVYGYKASVIRISQNLKNERVWKETQIVNRLDEMIGYIKKIWPYI